MLISALRIWKRFYLVYYVDVYCLITRILQYFHIVSVPAGQHHYTLDVADRKPQLPCQGNGWQSGAAIREPE